MALFAFKTEPLSAHKIISTSLISLPFFLLGGYLTGKWRWQELDNKYPRK
jgi:hypothetical protein